MTELPAAVAAPLRSDEVRVFTLDTGDGAAVREVAKRVLAAQVGVATDAIEIYAAPKGKPLLRNDASLHFSISHSQGIAMLAVTRLAPVGVDIEQMRAVPNAETILRRFFTHEDVSAILSDDNRDFRFMEAWTRSEARVKVRGASVWEAATPDPETIVRRLDAPDGFAASIAVASALYEVTQYNISVADVVVP
ncbi:MAG: 4'-phosphopantetheinyl transferase superfamily protein [Gemmatimonadaceae bacterium]